MTVPASLRDPDVLHGLLIYAERNFDPIKMAAVVGASVADMNHAIDQARTGRIVKAPFVNGHSAKVSEADAPPPAHNPKRAGNELFPRDWQRQCILAMMEEGGVGSKDIIAILESNHLVSPVSDRMGTLRISLQKAGMDFQTVDTNKPTVRYQIVGDHKANMLAVMKSGWAAQ